MNERIDDVEKHYKPVETFNLIILCWGSTFNSDTIFGWAV